MEAESVHDLTAAYALDALSPEERDAYEEHLARCARCRDELAQLGDAAGALAYAVDAPVPPEALRGRILDAARAERPNVVPLAPRRRLVRAVGAAAAVAACTAVGLGAWAVSLSRSLDRERGARAQERAALAVLGQQAARRVRVGGRTGSLFVAPTGEAALVLDRLPSAPHGKTYEAWVIRGRTPLRAGTFAGGGGLTAFRLDRAVPDGATVAVTVERAGGVETPSGEPILSARA